MVGHQMEEYRPVRGKTNSNALQWTLGLGILLLWGGVMAYVGYVAAQAVFIHRAIDRMDRIDALVATQTGTNTKNEERETAYFDRWPDILPAFSYPFGMHVLVIDHLFEGDLTRSAYVNDEPFWFCDACDAPIGPIVITSQIASTVVGNHDSFDAYIHAVFNEDRLYSNLKIAQLDEKHYKISGREEFGSNDFETVVSLTDQHVVTVTYTKYQSDNGALDDAWELILDSLDFSYVE